MNNSQKTFQFKSLVIFITLCSMFSTLFCFCDYPGERPTDILNIEANALTSKGKVSSKRDFYAGDTVNIRLTVHGVASVDTIKYGVLYHDSTEFTDDDFLAVKDSVIPEKDIDDNITTSIICYKPGKAYFVAVAHGDENSRYHSITLNITEDEDANTAPEITLTPYRTYAVAQSLPCSVSISCSDDQKWQEVIPSFSDELDNCEIINDTLGIWKPTENGTTGIYTLTFIAVDNSDKPKSDTASVTIQLVEDGSPPTCLPSLRVTQKNDETVTLSWDRDLLTDTFTVYRSSEADGGDWDAKVKIEGTTFTDTTGNNYFYRIGAKNVFDSCESGRVVYGADTLHFAHVISFADSSSTASENDPDHKIKMLVSENTMKDITVHVAVSRNSEEKDNSTVTIDKGDKSAYVTLSIDDDEEDEEPETLTVTIDSVSSGYPLGVLQHTVVITDNDTFFTVTYKADGVDEGDVPDDDDKYKRGNTVKVKENTGKLEKEGFIFTGWSTKEDGSDTTYKASDEFKMGSGPVTLYAQWDTAYYTVTFDSQGGSVLEEQRLPYGKTVTEPDDPEKEGKRFDGWFRELTYINKWDFAKNKIVQEITLYAKWTPVFRVIYNGNRNTDGEAPVDDTLYENSATVTVKSNSSGLKKERYVFSEWNTEKDGTGTSRSPGSTFPMGSNNVVLYAQWNRIYTVTFDGRSATKFPDSVIIQVIEPDKTIEMLPDVPLKDGCSFAGWYTGIIGSGTEFTTSTLVRADITVYALWTMSDFEGNVYKTVTIGTQIWMAENLKTTKFNGGTSIPLITNDSTWENLSTSGYCWYDNDTSYKEPYGALYNLYTVNSGKFAPEGWHVPSDSEWTVLQEYLIKDGYNYDGTTTGNKIAKSMAAKTIWDTSITRGTIGNDLTKNNRSGFSAFPGGYRGSNGAFYGLGSLGSHAYWWSASEADAMSTWRRDLDYFSPCLNRYFTSGRYGFSIRCVRD